MNESSTPHLPGLEILHKETLSWISDLEFLKEESRFLLRRATEKRLDMKDQVLIRLQYFADDRLDEVVHNLRAHEKFLAELVKGESGVEEKIYRQTHQMYSEQVRLTREDEVELKRAVFSLLDD